MMTNQLKTGKFQPGAARHAVRHVSRKPIPVRDDRAAAGNANPVSYRRGFIDSYEPNHSSLLPAQLAAALAREGAMTGQQPAGTYARKVLEPLLIDLSWSSSRLEGNRYTLPDTEELFARGAVKGDTDAVMLLNHKEAIEFMVDAVPEYGPGTGLVSNIHAILMRDLLMDSASLGTIRRKVVNISGTVYTPLQMPAQLAELYFHRLLTSELRQLGPHNGGRYRLAPRTVDAWIEDGRPQ
ncbi:MAG: hypothetical protein NVSMB6_31710 [Burkholderiaceae bacterium]